MPSSVRAAFGKMILFRGSRGLYSITKLMSGWRRDELAQAVDGQLPDVVVVDLERVVPAVLAGPQLHVVAAEFLGQLGGLVQQRQAPARGRPGPGW